MAVRLPDEQGRIAAVRIGAGMVAAARTDVGRVRSDNEDGVALLGEAGLLLVCDGLGGHVDGEIAAAKAIAEIVGRFEGRERIDDHEVAARAVAEALLAANAAVYALNKADGRAPGKGMGTTLVGLLALSDDARAIAFHVGDSRLYRFRAGVLNQVTRDHSPHQAWLDGGRVGPEPRRSAVQRAVGVAETMTPTLSLLDLKPGDNLMLCTDGLSDLVDDDRLARVLGQIGPNGTESACDTLVNLANDAGGRDNVTVVVARRG